MVGTSSGKLEETAGGPGLGSEEGVFGSMMTASGGAVERLGRSLSFTERDPAAAEGSAAAEEAAASVVGSMANMMGSMATAVAPPTPSFSSLFGETAPAIEAAPAAETGEVAPKKEEGWGFGW